MCVIMNEPILHSLRYLPSDLLPGTAGVTLVCQPTLTIAVASGRCNWEDWSSLREAGLFPRAETNSTYDLVNVYPTLDEPTPFLPGKHNITWVVMAWIGTSWTSASCNQELTIVGNGTFSGGRGRMGGFKGWA